MRPEIKELYSSEVELEGWEPKTLGEVYFLADVEIGEPGDGRKDLFFLTVATPEGLRANAKDVVIADRALLVLSEYSLDILKEHLSKLLVHCEGPTWQDVSVRLQRYFRWEYEDFVDR